MGSYPKVEVRVLCPLPFLRRDIVLLFGIDRKFSIKIDDIELSGEFPLPKDERNIELELAKRLQYTPTSTISQDIYQFEYICVVLNYTIKNKPKELTDFSEIYDVDFTLRVYNEYAKQKKALDESLKKNNRSGNDSRTGEKSGDNSEPLFDEKLQPKTRRVS